MELIRTKSYFNPPKEVPVTWLIIIFNTLCLIGCSYWIYLLLLLSDWLKGLCLLLLCPDWLKALGFLLLCPD